MKESVTKFDFEAAFKALDEIDTPASKKGIKANRPALTEIFSRKSKFDSLFEEYYDVGNTEELSDAKEAREAEIAKAKLERIEKIVDLDAKSPEDLQTSYVGKYIIQCPQCMTLFYKNKEDVVESEDDTTTVNVGEVCQHCGNESGYTLVGKVGEAEEESEGAEEMSADETTDENTEETTEESTEETTNDELEDLEGLEDLNLDSLEIEEPTEEEKTEEAFTAHEGEALVEEFSDDKELDAKLDAHNEYIAYLRNVISEEEKELEKTDNEQVKAAIQRRIDAFKADLEAALPNEVKNELSAETQENQAEEEPQVEENPENEAEVPQESVVESLTESTTRVLKEEADLEVSVDEFKDLIDSPEFKKPISDVAVRAMLNSEKESEEENKEVKESKSIYGCSNCGYEIEMDDEDYDGCCPNCHEHHGEFVKLDEGIFDGTGITRNQQADWVLKNAKENFNDSNSAAAFNTFVIYYFKGNFRKDENDTEGKGKKITVAPKPENKDLVVGQAPDAKKSYKDASKLASGWSMINGNGPAMIFMAKNINDTNKTFLCEYFKGDLVASSDQLADMVDQIKKSLKGSKKMSKANPGQPDYKDIVASEVKVDTKIQYNNETCTVIEVKESRDKKNYIFTVKFEDGEQEPITVEKTKKVKVAITTESLSAVMTEVEELQEDVLEKLISDSLVEAYGNVAGYRVTNCEYLNEKLVVDGTAYFTSGNTRKLTYTFTEACNNEGKLELRGLNKKLGTDKNFTLTGKVENKTLITESFKCNK